MLPAIIFIHGYKGSVLRLRDSGAICWISAAEALWGSRSLALQAAGLHIPEALDLRVAGVLERVCIVPRLLCAQVYGPWLGRLSRAVAGRARVVPLAYDWRRSNFDAVCSLAALVDELRAAGAPAVHLVAHSMGGLVAAYYLRYGAQDPSGACENWVGAAALDRVVIAGTPYRGLMRALHDMAYGTVTVCNRSLLGPVAVASMPSVYQLLPWPAADKVILASPAPSPGHLWHAPHWRDGGWGLFADSGALCAGEREARLDYVDARFAESRRWFELLHAPQAGPPRGGAALLNIRGRGFRTLERVVWCPREGRLIFDERQARRRLPAGSPATLTTDGDRTVTLDSAALPPAYARGLNAATQDFRVGHAAMYSDRRVQRTVLDFLLD